MTSVLRSFTHDTDADDDEFVDDDTEDVTTICRRHSESSTDWVAGTQSAGWRLTHDKDDDDNDDDDDALLDILQSTPSECRHTSAAICSDHFLDFSLQQLQQHTAYTVPVCVVLTSAD